MAWRFQASKFKNTTPHLPKKEDTIFDLPIGNLSCTNNGVQASGSYLAFHVEGEGGKLGALPINAKGRKLRKDMAIVCAHADQIDDFCFMTFNDDLLVTCSRDDNVKLWRLSGEEATPSLECEIHVGNGVLMDSIKSHSTASNIIAAASVGDAYVIDVERKVVATKLHGFVDKGQSVDWSEDGKLLAVSADKGREVCVYDARSGTSPIQRLAVHQGLGRESRVLFCGDRLLSSGFTSKRAQEVHVLDVGRWDTPIHTQEYVSATGVLMPFYDPDTKLVFLIGKGTNKLFIAEFQSKVPHLSPVYEMSLAEQNLGACLGSKRNVKVMDGEVDTLYQLTKHCILPIPCIVPRRSYRDFHADLFPDTRGPKAGCTSAEWLAGSNSLPEKVSLAPNGTNGLPYVSSKTPSPISPPVPTVKEAVKTVVEPRHSPDMQRARAQTHPSHTLTSGTLPDSVCHSTFKPKIALDGDKPEVKELVYTVDDNSEKENGLRKENDSHHKLTEVGVYPKLERSTSVDQSTVSPVPEPPIRIRQLNDKSDRSISARVRPKSCVVGVVASKFRHVETLIGARANNTIFTNIRNVNTQLPLETNGACTSGKFVAVPLKGPAGVVGIYDVEKPGKLPDGVMDGIFNKAQVTDLHWNPFDDEQLAVGTDVGLINFWRLTRDDGPRNEMHPEKVLNAGGEKILCFQWHPMASDLLAVALSDNSIEIWESKTLTRRRRIVSHSAAVMALGWSSDGHRLVSIGKDLMLNVHQPQLGDECLLAQRKVLDRAHSGRVLYACDDRLIIVVGMTRSSSRQVQLFDASSLEEIYTQQIDSGTQPLVPHYDYDSSVLFLSAKGNRTINMYEVSCDSPYLLPLTPYTAPLIGQAIAFHNKKRCDVMAVEFQRAWRLTERTLEQVIFRVPRVKKDVFQSDLFPDALVTWRPVMTAEEWLAGSSKTPLFESLMPEGVSALAKPVAFVAPSRAPPKPAVSSLEHAHEPKVEPNRKEVQNSWSSKILEDRTLEQDEMEGVSEEEWTESL
uniref:Coronin n=1 Tax=Haemonchus contortus TaxID=6289 RepID=A0A7I4YBI6_HAECO